MNRNQFLTVVVITFIVVIVWVIADILFNTKSSLPPNPNLPSLLEDVNPTFNSEALNRISEKDSVPPLISLPESKQVKTPTQESTGSSIIIATDSALLR
jgi:hypothetical protein